MLSYQRFFFFFFLMRKQMLQNEGNMYGLLKQLGIS